MANPLYDRLFGAYAGKQTPFLRLADGRTVTHAQFLEQAFHAGLRHDGRGEHHHLGRQPNHVVAGLAA